MQPSDSCVATSNWYEELPVIMFMCVLGFFTCKLFMLSGKMVPAGPPRATSTIPANKLGGTPDKRSTKDNCSQVAAKASTTSCMTTVAAAYVDSGNLWTSQAMKADRFS